MRLHSWSATALVLAACSEVVVPAEGGGDAANGAGGSTSLGGSASIGGSTSTNGSTSGSTGSSTSTSTSTSSFATSSTSTTSGEGAFGSSSSGEVEPGSECDEGREGDPGSLFCKECQQCALTDVCEVEVSTCQNDAECSAFIACDQDCDDCDCEADHPSGSTLHDAVIDCLECACLSDCGTTAACAD